MGEYLKPERDIINWNALNGLIELGATFISILGVTIIALSVIYCGISVIKMLIGKENIPKKKWTLIVIGVVVGLLLLTGGWISIVKLNQETFIL